MLPRALATAAAAAASALRGAPLLRRGLASVRGGYVNYDPTAGQAMPDIPNVGTKLPLRAILFDYDVLSQVHDYDADEEAAARAALYRVSGVKAVKEFRRPEELVAAGDASTLLRREMRAELRHRGLDPTGKPWQLRARLQEALDAERAAGGGALGAIAELERLRGGGGGGGGGSSSGPDHREFPLDRRPSSFGKIKGAQKWTPAQATAGAGSSSSSSSSSSGSGGGGGGSATADAAGVRAKYMAALRAKQDKAREREADPRSSGAAALARAPEAAAAAAQDGGGGASTWSLNHGAQPLLKYLAGRGIQLGLALPAPADATAEQVRQFEEQAGAHFAFRLAHEQAARYGEAAAGGGGAAVLRGLCERHSLAPMSLMVLTTQSAAIGAARDAGCFSCHFLPKNARRPNIRPSFSVALLLQVQSVVEELNGISWRGSAVD